MSASSSRSFMAPPLDVALLVGHLYDAWRTVSLRARPADTPGAAPAAEAVRLDRLVAPQHLPRYADGAVLIPVGERPSYQAALRLAVRALNQSPLAGRRAPARDDAIPDPT